MRQRKWCGAAGALMIGAAAWCVAAVAAAGVPAGKQAPKAAAQSSVAADAKDLIVTDESDGKTVSASIGQKIVIRIPSEGPGPKPPPQWTARLKGESLRLEGEIRLRAKTIAGPAGVAGVQQGGPMTAEAVLTAVKAGKTAVTLESRQRGQPPDAKPSGTFTVTVDVQAVPAAASTTKPTEDDVKLIALKALTERWPNWRKEYNVSDDSKVFRDIVRPGQAKDWHVTLKTGPAGDKPPLIVLVRVDPETGGVLEVTKGGGGLR
jgi:hypothetical protein